MRRATSAAPWACRRGRRSASRRPRPRRAARRGCRGRRACALISGVVSRVLLGPHSYIAPSRRTVPMTPPGRAPASSTATRRPALCSRKAAVRPEMPAPTTTTSSVDEVADRGASVMAVAVGWRPGRDRWRSLAGKRELRALPRSIQGRRQFVVRGRPRRQLRQQQAPPAGRRGIVALLVRGAAGHFQRPRMRGVQRQRALDQLGRLADQRASLRHAQCVGVLAPDRGVGRDLRRHRDRLLVVLRRVGETVLVHVQASQQDQRAPVAGIACDLALELGALRHRVGGAQHQRIRRRPVPASAPGVPKRA